jgi:acyl-CoA-binding protein
VKGEEVKVKGKPSTSELIPLFSHYVKVTIGDKVSSMTLPLGKNLTL